MGAYFEIYRIYGEWRWRLRDGNHRIIGTSGEAYASQWNTERAVENVKREAPRARVVINA